MLICAALGPGGDPSAHHPEAEQVWGQLDAHEVYFAVFDPLDDRSPNGLWGFSERDFALMTRGQQAVCNLDWLRNYMEADTILEHAEEPGLRAHAHLLVTDAELVGAWAFTAVLAEIAPIVAQEQQPPFDDSLFDEVERLEKAFFALEHDNGSLWHFLADYIRRTPVEFIQSQPVPVGTSDRRNPLTATAAQK